MQRKYQHQSPIFLYGGAKYAREVVNFSTAANQPLYGSPICHMVLSEEEFEIWPELPAHDGLQFSRGTCEILEVHRQMLPGQAV